MTEYNKIKQKQEVIHNDDGTITVNGEKHIHGDKKFYGRRGGRTIDGYRKELMENYLPQLELKPSEYSQDPKTWFNEPMDELWVEVGCGGGEHLSWQAQNNKNIGIVGAEPFLFSVGSMLRHLKEHEPKNVRLIADDIRPMLESLPDQSVSRVFLLFPDPWPKVKHHRRRFVNPHNLDTISRILKKGGEFRFGSDHAELVTWTLKHLEERTDFKISVDMTSNEWRTRPDDWCPTRYEQKAVSKGIPCAYLIFTKI